MAAEMATSDFISRVRQRHHAEPDEAPSPERTFIVQITRDGKATEDLIFERAPTIGAIAARAGTDAYVIAVDVIQHRAEDQLAAE